MLMVRGFFLLFPISASSARGCVVDVAVLSVAVSVFLSMVAGYAAMVIGFLSMVTGFAVMAVRMVMMIVRRMAVQAVLHAVVVRGAVVGRLRAAMLPGEP